MKHQRQEDTEGLSAAKKYSGTSSPGESGDRTSNTAMRIPAQSHLFHAVGDHKHAYRVCGIPNSYDTDTLYTAVATALKCLDKDGLRIYSLASDRASAEHTKTATVSFMARPALLHGESSEWRIDIPSGPDSTDLKTIYIDSHFLGFTPISPAETDHLQTIDCVVIHGWGGHALGSFRDPSSCFVWLRDEVATKIPTLRIWVYGYDSSLRSEDSYGDMHEYAATFRSLLKTVRITSGELDSSSPLIYIAHSLGGLLLKEAFISMKNGGDAEKAILAATFAVLFFGVPSQGMNTEAMAAMVENNPQRLTLELLNQNVGNTLRERQQRAFCEAFSFRDSRFVRFYELVASPTVREDQVSGKLVRDGTRALLVSKPSAKQGRPWDIEEGDTVPLNADHMGIVKFLPGDRVEYPKVETILLDLAQHAVEVIQLRLARLATNEGQDLAFDTRSLTLGGPKAHQSTPDNTSSYTVPFSLAGAPVGGSFIGRKEDLELLKVGLDPEKGVERRQVHVIYGLGGLGKTQLAIEFARLSKQRYTAVFWLNGTTEESLVQSILQVGKRIPGLNHSDPGTATTLAKAKSKALQYLGWFSKPNNTKWLLIYDNVDQTSYGAADNDLDALQTYNIEEYLPDGDVGSIIITTRLQRLSSLGESLRLKKLNYQESLALLEKHSKKSFAVTPISSGIENKTQPPVSSDISKLIQKLDGLPLALVLAGTYLLKTTVSKYLELYVHSWAELHASMRKLSDYPNRTIVNTWMISFRQIARVNQPATNLLRMWGWLDNRDLWYDLLCWPPSLRSKMPEWLKKITTSEIAFLDTMETLLDQSMIEQAEDSSGYTLHSVIHDWIRSGMPTESADTYLVCGFICLGLVAPDKDTTEYWILERRLLPHVDQACLQLETIDNVIESKEGDEAELLVRALFRLGVLYLDQGRLSDAERMYDRALAGYVKEFGPDHSSTLDAMNNLGVIYRSQGRLEEARQMYDRVFSTNEKVLGPDDISTLQTLNNIGVVVREQDHLDEAARMFERVLAGYEKALGQESTLTLDAYSNLGSVYHSQGRRDDSKQMLERALAGQEKLLGREHISTVRTVNNIGISYEEQGLYDEAEPMYDRALAGFKKALGEDHTLTLEITQNLGLLYKNQGRLDDAERMLSRALAGFERTSLQDTIPACHTMYNFASVLGLQGKYKVAEQMFERALAGYTKIFGPQYQWAVKAMEQIEELQSLQME